MNALLDLFREKTFLRGDFIYPASVDPSGPLLTLRSSLDDAGITFQYFKGNDTLLHYTLVDWTSGVRRMADLLGVSREMWSIRRCPQEWLLASFLGNFVMDSRASRAREESPAGMPDPAEVSARLVWNGRAFLGRETWSLVLVCNSSGLITGVPAHAQAHNLRMIIRGLEQCWTGTRPVYGWVGVGAQPVLDVPHEPRPTSVPRHAWFVFFPPEYAREFVTSGDGARKILSQDLADGSLLVENLTNRPCSTGLGM